jgi:hypothetical protein
VGQAEVASRETFELYCYPVSAARSLMPAACYPAQLTACPIAPSLYLHKAVAKAIMSATQCPLPLSAT